LYINVAGLDAMRDELLASGLHVGYHHLDPFWEPGAISVMPVPMTMEQADPGGVSCTNRSASFTWRS
jgi:hypothetical protein